MRVTGRVRGEWEGPGDQIRMTMARRTVPNGVQKVLRSEYFVSGEYIRRPCLSAHFCLRVGRKGRRYLSRNPNQFASGGRLGK